MRAIQIANLLFISCFSDEHDAAASSSGLSQDGNGELFINGVLVSLAAANDVFNVPAATQHADVFLGDVRAQLELGEVAGQVLGVLETHGRVGNVLCDAYGVAVVKESQRVEVVRAEGVAAFQDVYQRLAQVEVQFARNALVSGEGCFKAEVFGHVVSVACVVVVHGDLCICVVCEHEDGLEA